MGNSVAEDPNNSQFANHFIKLPEGFSCILEASRWGDYFEFKVLGQQGFIVERTSQRGKIRGMSLKSRLRLIAALYKIPVRLKWLTTLTYSPETRVWQTLERVKREMPKNGQQWPPEAILAASQALQEAKSHLDLLLRWLRKEGIICAWFMEFTKRGIPHFHLLSETWFAVPEKTVFRKGRLTTICSYEGRQRDFVNRWCVISGQSVSSFQKGGITERLRAEDAAVRYVAKEAGKRIQKEVFGDLETGRMWAVPRQWTRKPDEVIVVESRYFPRFTRIFSFSGTGARLDNGRLDVLEV